MIVLGKKVLIVKRVIVVVTDNKMTIQSLKIHALDTIWTKFPDFYHKKPQKIPHNNFAKMSLSSKQSFINGVNKPFMGLFLLSNL